MTLCMILLPFIGALTAYILGKKDERRAFLTAAVTGVLTFCVSLAAVFLPVPELRIEGAVGLGLHLKADGFRKIYVLIIAFMWMMTIFLSKDYFEGHKKLTRYFFFTLLTLSSTIGVFISADLFTALVFFEVMSFASFPWVIQEETPDAIGAANTYLFIAVIGGLAALMGLFLLYHEFGTLEIAALRTLAAQSGSRKCLYISGGLILFGFGAKAGMFPLHIWLPKAHPVAPAPASALLSGVLTKAGVFGIIVISVNLFPGDIPWGILIVLFGTVTMLLGAVLALFSVNLKRTLACSSMSQIGFILIGIGCLCLLGSEGVTAARGAFMHMVNHSLFKLVLFMCAGVVFMNAHTLDLNRLKGFGRGKPVLQIAFFLAAAGIAGVPGLNGYLSKTLLHEGIVECAGAYPWMKAVEWIFLFSGGLTLSYMTKLYVCLFVDKMSERRHEKTPYMGKLSHAALIGSAVLLPILGTSPRLKADRLMDMSAEFFGIGLPETRINYFAFENLKGAFISIAIGVFVYIFVVRKLMMKEGRYLNRWPEKLDLEELIYRPLILDILPGFFGKLSAIFGENRILKPVCTAILRFFGVFTHALSDLPDGLVFLFRRTAGKESPVPNGEKPSSPVKDTLTGVFRATHDVTDNLSFALLMLCLAVAAVLIYILLIRNPI